MQGKPLRILLSARAMEICGERVRGVLGDRPAELLASETAGPAPDAEIGFVTRDVIDNATADKPYRLIAAPARTFLNSTFTETPGSLAREKRPTALIHPEDCAALGVKEGDRVTLGNERGEVIVHVKPQAGQQRGVVVVEGIWPNKHFDNGIGINAITSSQPGWPNGGAVFHDTAVWIKAA